METLGPASAAFLLLGCLIVVSVSWLTYIARGGRPANISISGLGIQVNIVHPESHELSRDEGDADVAR